VNTFFLLFIICINFCLDVWYLILHQLFHLPETKEIGQQLLTILQTTQWNNTNTNINQSNINLKSNMSERLTSGINWKGEPCKLSLQQMVNINK
jgi:hypothetical protein